MLTIPQIIAQIPSFTMQDMPADVDQMMIYLRGIYVEQGSAPRSISVSYEPVGWKVLVDGINDPAIPTRQAGSRGGWPTMRHALLAAILIAERPELPISGQ